MTEGADGHPAVCPVAGAVQHRHVVPGQPLAAVQEGGLVGLDGEPVVRLLDRDQQVRSLGVGLERVGGDHRAGQVQALKQRLEAGHLARGAVDLALGQHPAGGVPPGGQQVDLPAAATRAGQRLAVHRDRPSPLVRMVTVGQPRANHPGQRLGIQTRQGPADGGLAGHHPVGGASRRAPSASRTGCGASAAHSAIAVMDRAPVSTAAAAMARIATSG
jgi:hypothetical protein